MDYSLLIEERKSTRAFKSKAVPSDIEQTIKSYHDNECMRLIPDIDTEIIVAGSDSQAALEGAAGYNDFIVGAPSYIILLSAPHEHALYNAGYITEDLSLKLNDLGYGACFLTFTDSDSIKQALGISSEKDVVSILAFGTGERKKKKMHINVLTMSNISSKEKQQYFAPKKGVSDLVYSESFGNTDGVMDLIDHYGDVLWESFLAASNSPSYMNLQPYAFIIKNGKITLVTLPDHLTGDIDKGLNLGVVMQHVASVASSFRGNALWSLDCSDIEDIEGLPDGSEKIASFSI